MNKVLALTSQELPSVSFSLEESHLFTYYFPSFPRGDKSCQRMFMDMFDGLFRLHVNFLSEDGESAELSVCIEGKLVCFDNPEKFKQALLVNMDRKAQILNVVSNTNDISSPGSFIDYFFPKGLQRSDSLTSVSTVGSSVCEGEAMVRSRSLRRMTCLQDMLSMKGLSNPNGGVSIIDSSLLSHTGLSSEAISAIKSCSYFDEQAFMKGLIVYLNTSQRESFEASEYKEHPHFRVMASLLDLESLELLSFESSDGSFLKNALCRIFEDAYEGYMKSKMNIHVTTFDGLLQIATLLSTNVKRIKQMDLFRCFVLSHFFKEDVLTELRASIDSSGLYTKPEAMALRGEIIDSFEGYIDPRQHCVIHGEVKALTTESKFMRQFSLNANSKKREALSSINTFLVEDFKGQACEDFRAMLAYVAKSV